MTTPTASARARFRQWLPATAVELTWFAAQAGAAAVVLGSLNFRTTRLYNAGLPDETLQADGAHRWAGWTLLLGFAALGLGAGWRKAGPARPLTAMGMAAALGWAARLAGAYHERVLAEQRDPTRFYELSISHGMAIVTVAGIAGASAALVLAGLSFHLQIRARR